MIWLVFALLAAFFHSLIGVFGKYGSKKIDETILTWALSFFSLFLVLPLLFFIEIPSVGIRFWISLIVTAVLTSITWLLYVRAVSLSDLSVTVPMLTFTPVFLLITSPLMLGEFPTVLGLVGILLIVIGSYTLNIKSRSKGYSEPFKALLKEKGSRYALIVAFIYSITSNIDKIGILESSPIFWIASVITARSLILSGIVLKNSKSNIKQISGNLKYLMLGGLATGLMLVFQMLAVSMAIVPYVISIKRTSGVMSVLLGMLFFKEKNIQERLLGSLIMVIGVFLIALG